MTRKRNTRNDGGGGIISKAINAFTGGSGRSILRVFGVLFLIGMVAFAPIFGAFGGLFVGQAAASDGGTLYSTTTDFDSVQIDGMDSTTTNDMVSIDGTTTSGSDSYYTASVSSHDSVDVDVASVAASVDLIAVDGSGTVVDTKTVSTAGTHSLTGADIQEVEFRVLDTDGLAEINSFEVYDSAATGAVDVTVEDDSGNAVESADVELIRVTDGTTVATQTTDTSGFSSFSGIEQGQDYDINVNPPTGHESGFATFTHNSDPSTQTISVSKTIGDITGTVTDEDTGNIVENYTVELKDDTGTVVASSTTDTNGEYVFADMNEGEYMVVFNDGTTYESQTKGLILDGGDNLTVDGVLVPITADTGSIQAEVVDGSVAVDGASVSIIDDTDTEVASGTTGTEGIFTASALAPGDYTVEITHNDTTHTQTVTVENEVTAGASFDLSTEDSNDGSFLGGLTGDGSNASDGIMLVAALIVVLGTIAAIVRD